MSDRTHQQGLVAGVDVGGTNMQFGIVDAGDRIVGRARARTESSRGTDHVLDGIAGGVREACAAAKTSVDELDGVGVAAAGAMDVPRGVVLRSPNLGWTNLPLRDLLQERLGRPIVLDNDVTGAVWGEHCAGVGRGCDNILGVWVGTGVGGGLVLNGQIHHGDFFTAGEIGHMVLWPNGRAGRRIVEDACSRTGMLAEIGRRLDAHPESPLCGASGGDLSTLRTGDLVEAYASGDALAQQVINEAADLLGLAIANVVTLLAVRTVIIGGGIAEALGEPYLERIHRSFERDVFPPKSASCEFRLTALRENAGLLGAAYLARSARAR